jgi:hypothetical protein
MIPAHSRARAGQGGSELNAESDRRATLPLAARGNNLIGPAVVVLTIEQLEDVVLRMFEKHEASKQSAPPAEKEKLCTVRNGSEQLHCCERQINRFCKIGRLQSVKIGSRRYITQESIDRFLAEEIG